MCACLFWGLQYRCGCLSYPSWVYCHIACVRNSNNLFGSFICLQNLWSIWLQTFVWSTHLQTVCGQHISKLCVVNASPNYCGQHIFKLCGQPISRLYGQHISKLCLVNTPPDRVWSTHQQTVWSTHLQTVWSTHLQTVWTTHLQTVCGDGAIYVLHSILGGRGPVDSCCLRC